MNKIKKTLLMASIIALGAEACINLSTQSVNAYENQSDSNAQGVETQKSSTMSDEDKAILRINEGTEELKDYRKLRVSNVKKDNQRIVQNAIKIAKEAKHENLNKAEIVSVVSKITGQIKESMNKINSGTGSLEDYKVLMLDKVNDSNVADLNDFLKDKRYPLISQISSTIDDVINALKNINEGICSESDFTALQVNRQVRSSDISIINKAIEKAKTEKGANLNRSEIKSITTEVLDKIKLILGKVGIGEASVDDYHYIGVEAVNEVYLNDVNSWLKNKRLSEVINVGKEVNKIVLPLNNINDGVDSTEDYESLDLQEVSIDETNIDSIRKVIKEKKNAKGKNLCISEISEAINEAQNIINLFEFINDGSATVQDFEDAEISGVTEDNIEDVNTLLKGKELYSKGQVQTQVDKILDSLKNINNNSSQVIDFENLEIVGVTADNIGFVKEIVKKTKIELGKDLNRTSIKNAVDKTLNYISIINKISRGEGSLEDYTALGITEVTEENREYVNAQVKDKVYKNIDELKEKITEALKDYESYKNINDGKGTPSDYFKLHIKIDERYIEKYNDYFKHHHSYTHKEVELNIKVVTIRSEAHRRIISGTASREDFIIDEFDEVSNVTLTYIKERIKEIGYSVTVEQIKEIIKTAEKHQEIINEFRKGNVSAVDFKNLGINGVTDGNISFILKRLKYEVYTTEFQLKSITEHIVKEYEIYGRISAGTATVEDYNFLKVTNVSSSSVEAVNNYLKSCNIYNKEEIQSRIDAVVERMENKSHIQLVINRISSGYGTVADFKYINITSVNEANLSFINMKLIKEQCTSEENIKASVEKIIASYNLFEKVSLGNADVNDFASIGITEVNNENILFVNANIKESKIFDIHVLKERVNSILSIYDYYQKINLGTATIEYYLAIGIDNITEENVSFVNEHIKNRNIFEIESLKENINIIINRYDAFVRINTQKASLKDYTDIGVINVNAENIKYINENLKLSKCFDILVIQDSVNIIAERYSCFAKINSGSAEVKDYNYLGITGVNIDNIRYINAALINTNIFENTKIQSVVENITSVYESLVRINLGTASLEDYKEIGVEGVIGVNLSYVNKDMKAKQYTSIKDIKSRVEKVFSLYSVFGRINMGIATIEDYADLGVSIDNSEKLAYINNNIKGNSYDNESSVKHVVNYIMAQYELELKIKAILVNINLGKATLEEYQFLDIVSVTSENIDSINIELKGKNYTDVTAIRNRVNVIVMIQNALKNINLGKATIRDYEVIGIWDLTEAVIPFVNEDMKGHSFNKALDVQSRIEENRAIYNVLCNINLGKAELKDYKLINITSINSELLSYVNADLKSKNYLTVSEVQDRVGRQLSIYTALERIIRGIASINDYNNAKITGVDSSILAYVNDDIAFCELRTVEQIQARIDNRIEIYNSLKAINNGTAVLNNYSILGIIDVREKLLPYVNADLKGANYINADEVKVRIEQNLNVYEILLMINEGKASLDNYYELNVECVTDYNRNYINREMKGTNIYIKDAAIERIEYLAANMVENTVSGTVIDATTGEKVSGVKIRFKVIAPDGETFLTKDGEEVTATTDAEGKYTIVLPKGEYKGCAIKANYIGNDFTFESYSNNSAQNNIALVPERSSNIYCAVLTWSNNPNDLDSHLNGEREDGTSFHVYYPSDKRNFVVNGETMASLDIDDTDGNGPETITFTADNGDYKYSIKDYSNRDNSLSTALSRSQAVVKLYKGNELVKVYEVPNNIKGTEWTVFEVKNGQLININSIK